MPFPAARVGLELAAHEKTLSVRDILAYAAGLGAAEPAFLDDVGAVPLRALPFQCVSLEWPPILSMREKLGDQLSSEEGRKGVHAVQDSVFHRPMQSNDKLVTTGRLVSAKSIRAGVLAVCKLSTRDAITGEAVTTSWTSSIYRDVTLAGTDASLESPPALAEMSSHALPTETDCFVFRVPREMPHIYSECAQIWNPIHTERGEALAAGLPDIILHGTATWALAGLRILRRYANNDVTRLKRFSGRFTGVVIPGEEIRIRHLLTAEGLVRFDVATEGGKLAISHGIAVLS